MSELAPVGERERVVSLDVLRGFALWGVLMGNLTLYIGRFIDESPPSTLDTIAAAAFSVLVENKAFTVLTFLFGFGFANLLVRAQQRGESGTGVFVRRLLVLFALGVSHLAFLWFGDITWTYAVAGFALLAFRNTSNGVRLVCGLLLAVVPFTLSAWLDGWRVALLFLEPGDWLIYARQYVDATRTAGYLEMMRENIQFALVWQAAIFVWYFPTIVGRFLIGYVAGAQRWFDRDGADHLPLFRRMVIGGLLVGIPCSAIVTFNDFGGLAWLDRELPWTVDTLLFTIELMALAASYIGIVVLLVQRPRWRRVLSIVAPVGRMPLTTYVSQSLILTTLFWGRGLAWHPPGVAAGLGLCLIIFVVQVAVAHVWLRRFRFGPLEWIWRSLVYLRPQPMRL